MFDILQDTFLDSVKLLPFLFITYLAMELLEHHSSASMNEKIKKAGRLGPVWGGILGIVPQCGFSAAASSLYAGGVISVGTLLAIFLSTSDEMFPIMVSNAVPFTTIFHILLCKCGIAILSGLAVNYANKKIFRGRIHRMHIHELCESEDCHCEDGPYLSAFKHTVKIYIYIFLITFSVSILMETIGEAQISQLFSGLPVIGQMAAALIGLIPNCASSVLITQLYLSDVISAGTMMAGLLVNAGVGLLILFRMNHDRSKDLKILGVLYVLGVFWGVLIDLVGIVF
ncbi:MAG: putative manganese transporter [Eubacteriales bacterium]|nr:putative manganese transporter [Eubacteriales bacterium]